MKKHAICLAAALALAGANAAPAQINISNPTISLALSNADILAGTGAASWGHRAMGVAPDGTLVIVSTNSGNAGMWTVDLAGAPDFAQVATEAELLSALGHASIDCNGVAVAASGTIYASFFSGTDAVLEIVPGSPATIASIRSQDGIGTIRLSRDSGTLFISEISAFGAAANQISALPLLGGSETVAVSVGDLTAVSGAASASFGPMDVDAAGDLIFFDEMSFGGSDGLFRLPEGGSIAAILGPGDFPAPPGVNALAADDLGNIFMFDEVSGATSDSILIFGAGGSGFHRIEKAEIDAATGLANYEFKTLHAHTVSPTEVVVYGSDDEADGVVAFSFTAGPAAAGEWTLHE